MSTLIGEQPSTHLPHEGALSDYFARFAKAQEAHRVGVEVEVLGVNSQTGKALPYEGSVGIQSVLRLMSEQFGYEPIFEGGSIIALRRNDAMISLEPGGQVELSAPPAFNVFENEEQIDRFLTELRAVKESLPGVSWIASGIQPYSTLDEISWVPKVRYQIMSKYLGEHGTQSHHMMKRTATNQVNFDYLNEEDAMESLRVAFSVTSIVSALFANSCFSEGKPNGFMTRRLDIWNHTDPDRSGLLSEFVKEGKRFSDYLEYILEMPMLFVVRQGQWIAVKNRTFRQFIRDGYEGIQATFEDFELQLSIAFPEARIKQYLEVRGADCQSPELIPAVAAFWKGLLYRSDARKKALELVSFATDQDLVRLHEEVPRLGLRAKLGSEEIFPIAHELVQLSCQSLAKQKVEDETRNECLFLDKIREKIIYPRQSPSDAFLAWLQSQKSASPQDVVNYLSI